MEFTDTTILTAKLCLKNYNLPTNDKMRGFKQRKAEHALQETDGSLIIPNVFNLPVFVATMYVIQHPVNFIMNEIG